MSDSDAALLVQHLCSQVQSFHSASSEDFSAGGRCWIALSGGVDSSALLHLAHASGLWGAGQLHAIHIDHRLQPASASWAAHCQRMCEAMGVPLQVTTVDIAHAPEGLENAAREARYAVFADLLQEGDLLLMGHHQDDQAETVLMRMLRGAGPRGLAAMPATRQLGLGMLLRPLLGVARAELVQYAHHYGVAWVEDPSNQRNDVDRNYLRNEIMPLLKARWPAFANSLGQSAAHCGDADRLCAEFAAQQLAALLDQTSWGERLSLGQLVELPAHQQVNVIRFWLDRYAHYLPDGGTIDGWLQQWFHADEGANPRFDWHGLVLRRYRGGVFVDQPQQPMNGCFKVAIGSSLVLPIGRLGWQSVPAPGLSLHSGQQLQLQFAKPSEKYYLAGRQGGRSLKKIFQEYGVPPWFRERIPLLLVDSEPAAILGLTAGPLVLEGFQSASDSAGLCPLWTPATVKKARQT